MKKLINDPHDVVAETIAGFVAAHKDVVTSSGQFVERAEPKAQGKVGIISGGGSGHEPLHAGFVGYGMLDAAVPGPVFTSPTPDPIVAATKAADHGAGVLYIVKNYTGDVLNFDTAAELAEFDDIEVSQVIINDDAAVEDSLYTAGRRGVAGTVLVEKIAGAAAERGDNLAEVTAVATEVVKNTRSMGVALTSCTVPHVGKPSFDLGDSEVEIGIGIHGEPGRRREPMSSADAITDQLLDPVVEDLGLCEGERVIALVNGMGGTPSSELYIVYRRVAERLSQLGVVVERSLVGNYVTSLDMQGASVTLMRVSDELLELFDAPVNTVALRKGM
ncbi:dihydroxyacetone kinase subunit DhaK [Corynebacterium diphtheriae]|uniref:phosphoenolpyruvate--glycerone phosphotransferase n=1 Tax=Corynebacterium diphtheriae TaxID=1717 RepID=A0A811G3R3_CORDP|nr:dihydroxyacetone kinase subunit DhaK [Corynebacterium diphtheriae]AEX47483.1 putative dihydroxyacetone kinase sununit [Corynebacterium diphtheriae INCA 402]AEX70957.1 putative dihydroxyacetone kinase sununit [Corynebacterium diphtheriae PW8]OFI56809.1 dihydroxyacetone kinase subunit DhaK [Corynebacterium diphtheriae]OJH95750.1 dihydroxyacetone kinase subunit DhaK [Corynebacterium diphtheriae]OJI02645.1 dihydroxyacetone kinase subunit DhaK [Corynebacterium diphtheriae]